MEVCPLALAQVCPMSTQSLLPLAEGEMRLLVVNERVTAISLGIVKSVQLTAIVLPTSKCSMSFCFWPPCIFFIFKV